MGICKKKVFIEVVPLNKRTLRIKFCHEMEKRGEKIHVNAEK